MKITANPQSYIFPPRAKQAIPREETNLFHEMGWIAQLKYNDTHILIKTFGNSHYELWNRHEEKLRTYHPSPELDSELKHLSTQLPGYCLLDGGLLDQKHRAIKDTITIWDILVHDTQHMVGTTYEERHNAILKLTKPKPWKYQDTTFGLKISDNIFAPTNQPDWDQAWDTVHKINEPFEGICGPLLEGLVLKNPDAPLDYGFNENNNGEWLCRTRVKTGRHNF